MIRYWYRPANSPPGPHSHSQDNSDNPMWYGFLDGGPVQVSNQAKPPGRWRTSSEFHTEAELKAAGLVQVQACGDCELPDPDLTVDEGL